MRSARLLTAFILTILILLAAPGADAAPRRDGNDPQPLFVLDKAAPGRGSLPLLPNSSEEIVIQVNPTDVAANPSSFLIDLPDHGLMEAVRTSFVSYRPDWKNWFGTLRYASGKQETGSIHIGFHGATITASIQLDEGVFYRIVGGHGESHRLVRLDTEKTPPSCGLATPEDAGDAPLPLVKPRHGKAALPVTEKILSCSANPRIDVLAVYPAKAPAGSGSLVGYFDMTAAQESAFVTFVQNSISRANQVFANSGINAWYNLVGVVPLINQDVTSDPPLPSTGLRAGLDWMNQRHTELRNLRDAFGADVVTVYIPFAWQGTANTADRACGMANLPRTNDATFESAYGVVSQALDQRAFTVNRDTCGLDDFTLGHEIGHNYGMRHHDDPFNVSLYVYPWAKGFVFNDPSSGQMRATMMGCNCPAGGCVAGTNPVCNRVPYLSDPDKIYNSQAGVFMGARDVNGNDTHHNARVACDRVTGFSNFRAQSSNTPPNANFTVSCTGNGRTCSFNAGSSTDNAAIPSNNYWWDFGDNTGIVRTGSTTTHTYASAGTYRVHLVVKDSGGQTNVETGTASPPSPSYEGYHESSSCSMISGWAWDQTLPNGAINVNIIRDGVSIASVPANQFRQDLLNAGKGNGYHGFGYVPNSSWFDGQWHSVGVRYGGTNTYLNGSPLPIPIICGAKMFPGLTPDQNSSTGGQVYSVGTEFSSSQWGGQITKIGFYRAAGETGSNTLHLATNSGADLRTVPTSCSSAGWCWVSITPYPVNAGTHYRVWVNTNTQQVKTPCGLTTSGLTNGPLTAHQGLWSAGNTAPTTGSCSNFFVDVQFDM
ncbi:MAG TPA: DUF4082 domain-containing protein [Thermoanaerobaculia bacterium]|nr:DUF4082 domain-containing protein [Thermoanaerobaculia bacterium]